MCNLRPEPDHLKWIQFCFASGVPSQQEGDAARGGATGKSSDALIGRRLETPDVSVRNIDTQMGRVDLRRLLRVPSHP